MAFSYVGYVWALFGCACVGLSVGGVALALHLIGRRVDRGAPSVEVVRLRSSEGGDEGSGSGGDAA